MALEIYQPGKEKKLANAPSSMLILSLKWIYYTRKANTPWKSKENRLVVTGNNRLKSNF